jgi:hypothetical protein
MNQNETWGWSHQSEIKLAEAKPAEIKLSQALVEAKEDTHWSTAELDQLAETLRRDGICVIRNLFPQSVMQAWKAAFDQLFQERQAQPGGLAVIDETDSHHTPNAASSGNHRDAGVG